MRSPYLFYSFIPSITYSEAVYKHKQIFTVKKTVETKITEIWHVAHAETRIQHAKTRTQHVAMPNLQFSMPAF